MHYVLKLIMMGYHILHNPLLHSQCMHSRHIVPWIFFRLVFISYFCYVNAYLAFGFGPGSGLAQEMGRNSKRQVVAAMVILLAAILTKLLVASMALSAGNFPHPPFLDKGNDNYKIQS